MAMNPRLLRPLARLQAPPPPCTYPASLLLHFDGGFTDSSENALTVTANGDAAISTTEKKFGSGSAEFDGDGDYLTTPHVPALELADQDFTIEWWMYWTGGYMIFSYSTDHRIGVLADYASAEGNYLCLLVSDDSESWNVFTVDVGNGESGVTSLAAPKNQWCHVAITRSGSDWRLFIDGAEAFHKSASVTVASGEGLNFQIGGNWAGATSALDFEGYIDDFRITKGLAVYTGSFIPPTGPLSACATPVPPVE